jgi:hypothetical protein
MRTDWRGSESSVGMSGTERSNKYGKQAPSSAPSNPDPSSVPPDDAESTMSRGALPRPPMPSRSWDDLPGIRKRRSLAPPAPPPSHAPPAPTTHELFDVDSAEVEHARDAIVRRAAERASSRPHPPKRAATPEPPKVGGELAPRLSTPLSWEAAKPPTGAELDGAGLADAIDEEISDEFLEPVADSVPLALPAIASSEPLVSVIPTSALVVQPPAAPASKRWKAVGSVALMAVAALSVVWFVSKNDRSSPSQQAAAANTRVEPASLAAPAIEANPALRVPLPPLELDIGVPTSEPAASAEPVKPDPASVPPVAPSGVLPTRPPPVEHPPFDSAAATASLAGAAQSAAACRKEGDPAGAASVIVRFAPSGRATSAVVESGPFAGTVTGGCIATAFRKARVPPFTGDYVSVKKTISVN